MNYVLYDDTGRIKLAIGQDAQDAFAAQRYLEQVKAYQATVLALAEGGTEGEKRQALGLTHA